MPIPLDYGTPPTKTREELLRLHRHALWLTLAAVLLAAMGFFGFEVHETLSTLGLPWWTLIIPHMAAAVCAIWGITDALRASRCGYHVERKLACILNAVVLLVVADVLYESFFPCF